MSTPNPYDSAPLAPAAPQSHRTSVALAAVLMGSLGVGAAITLAAGDTHGAPATTARVQLANISIPSGPPCGLVSYPFYDTSAIECPQNPYGGPSPGAGNAPRVDPNTGEQILEGGWGWDANGHHDIPSNVQQPGSPPPPANKSTAKPAPPPPRDNFGDYGDSAAK